MSANDTQVGGTHYKAVIQHWDLAHELDLGYFEGQITKYITRHRSKKGREDLEKALHFTRKLRELAVLVGRQPRHKFGTIARFVEYAQANKLTHLEYLCIMSVCNWSMLDDLDMLLDRMTKLFDECYPPIPTPETLEVKDCVFKEVPHGYVVGKLEDSGEPGRGYVDQAKDI